MKENELSLSNPKEKLEENKDNKMDYKCKICQKIISGPIKSFESFYLCEICFSTIKSNNAAPNIKGQNNNINLNDNTEEIKEQVQNIKKYPDNPLLEGKNSIQNPSEKIDELKESFITPKEHQNFIDKENNIIQNPSEKIDNLKESFVTPKEQQNFIDKGNNNSSNLEKNNENNIINNENNIMNNENNIINNENNINQGRNVNNNNEAENINIQDNRNSKTRILIIIFGIIILIIAIFIQEWPRNNFQSYDEDKIEVFPDKNEKREKKKELNKPIIGIDFGSSYSGFSFGIDTETIETKYENIEPTILVIEKETRKGYKYGNEADTFMSNGRKNNYIYFDRIKTKLDPKFASNEQSEIIIEASFPKNYKMPLKLVIKEYLRMFSDNILNYVNLKGKSYSKDDIQWVITVPAIWNDYGKQLMIECSKKAGMNDISIALEPEAASLTMFNDNIVEKYLKEKGKKFMLIDAGGYTIDITLNEIIDDQGNLKQLSPPSGGAFGSMNINKDLINLVEEMFDKEKIDYLKEYRFDLWKITLDSIEKKKKEIKNDGSDADSFKIDTRFEENVCTSIYKCEKETSYGSVKFNNNYLEVPREVMKYIILKNVNQIIKHIKDLFEKFQNITIDVLILTGGFSNCKLLIEEIKKNFKTYRILSKPETSVMNGAVLYGIEPNQIISRKTPYTIGISSYSYHQPGTECKEKIIKDSNIFCRYFDIFKRKGDDIKNNEYIIKPYIPFYLFQTGVRFTLYYSNSTNPIYIDNENVKAIAEFDLDMKEIDRKLEERIAICKMVFSSSITVSAINVLSGEEVKIIANYYNRND